MLNTGFPNSTFKGLHKPHKTLINRIFQHLDHTLHPDPPLTAANQVQESLRKWTDLPDIMALVSQRLGLPPESWPHYVENLNLEAPLTAQGKQVAFVLERLMEAGGTLSHSDLLRQIDHLLSGAELREMLAQRTPRRGMAADAHPALCCPGCGEPMMVFSYGGDSGVFVDRCQSCNGLWLDCEELQRIQVLQERWADEAPDQLKRISVDLEKARQEAAQSTSSAFAGSRFAFINALINRYLDAA